MVDIQRLYNLKRLLERSSNTEEQFEANLGKCERENTKFVDLTFYPTKKFVDEDRTIFEEPDWRRIEDQYKSDLFENVSPHGIQQGKLGDCYFISSLIYVSKNINNVKSLFHPKSSLQHGIVLIYFYLLGERIPVIVDTQIAYPTNKSREPLFSKPRTNSDSCWFVLVEKAFAKACGGYKFIESGETHFGCHVLLNYFPQALETVQSIVIDQDEDIRISENELKERIFHKFQSLLKEGALVGSSVSMKNFPDKAEDNFESEYGIVVSHAYQILDARKVGNHKFIKVRNPWGRFEYKGEYSKESPKWTEPLKKELNYTDNEDGSFWMTFDEYRYFFRSLSYCIPNQNDWKVSTVCGCIDGYLDGRSPCSNSKHIGCIPQWTITFSRKTTVYLSYDCVGDESYYSIYICKNHGLKLSSINNNSVYRRLTTNNNFNGILYDIEDFSEPYTFFLTRTDPIPRPCYYLLRIQSPDQDFTINKLEDGFGSQWRFSSGCGLFDSANYYWNPFQSRPISTCKQWYIKFPQALNNKTVEIRIRVYKNVSKANFAWIIAKTNEKISFNYASLVSEHETIYGISDYEEYQLQLDNGCDDSNTDGVQWVFCIFRKDKSDEIDKFKFDILSKEDFRFGIMPEPDYSTDCCYTISGSLTHSKDDGATPYGGSVKNLKQWLLTFSKPTTLYIKYEHENAQTEESIYLERQITEGAKMETFYKGTISYNFDVDADSEFDQVSWKITDVSKPYTFCISRKASSQTSKYKVNLISKNEFTMIEFDGKEVAKTPCSQKKTLEVAEFPTMEAIAQPTTFKPKKSETKINESSHQIDQLTNQIEVNSANNQNSLRQTPNTVVECEDEQQIRTKKQSKCCLLL